jgi:hypothetical protein
MRRGKVIMPGWLYSLMALALLAVPLGAIGWLSRHVDEEERG